MYKLQGLAFIKGFNNVIAGYGISVDHISPFQVQKSVFIPACARHYKPIGSMKMESIQKCIIRTIKIF
jgi:hypothetical protein